MRKLIVLSIILFFILYKLVAQSDFYYENFDDIAGQNLPYYDYFNGINDSVKWDADTSNGYTWLFNYNCLERCSNMAYIVNQDQDSTQNESFDITFYGFPEPYYQLTELYIAFIWYCQMPENNGSGIDPRLDPDADLTVEMRYWSGGNPGNWSIIWKEDNQDLLESTTSGQSLNWSYYFNYDNYVNGSQNDDWFPAQVDILETYNPVIHDSLQVRFTYNGRNGGDVGIDNIKLIYNEIPLDQGLDIQHSIHPDYYRYIPNTQTQPLAFQVQFDNNGIDSSNAFSLEIEEDYVYEGLYAYLDVPDNDIDSNTISKSYEISNYIEQFTPEADKDYRFDYVNELIGYSVKGTNSNQVFSSNNIYISANSKKYSRWDGGFDGTLSADKDNNAFGALFEIVQDGDRLDEIEFIFNNSNNDFRFQIIKFDGPDPLKDNYTITYESDVLKTNGNPTNIDLPDSEDFMLTTGYYMIRVIQTSTNGINLYHDDNDLGSYYTGNIDNLTRIKGEGNLSITLKLYTSLINSAPQFADGTDYPETNNNFVMTTGQFFNYRIYTYDNENDDIGFRKIKPGNKWFDPTWLSITNNGDNTFTLSGKPDQSGTFQFDLRIGDASGDSTTQTFFIQVIYPFHIDIDEDFNTNGPDYKGWLSLNESNGSGNWNENDADGYANDFVGSDGQTVSINGNNKTVRKDNYISPAIKIPHLSNDSDSAIFLEFAWRMDWKYFTGSELGNINDGYDVADVSVLISDDGGETWSNPIWKEDDSSLVVSSSIANDNGTHSSVDDDDDVQIDPNGWPGYKNGNYTYSDDYYLSRINLSAYAGKSIKIKFSYESEAKNESVNAKFSLDFVDVKLIEPAIELKVIAENIVGYSQMPIYQAEPVNIITKVTNLDRLDLMNGQIRATITDASMKTVYNQLTTFDVNGEDTSEVVFKDSFIPKKSGSHTFGFDASYPDPVANTSDNFVVNFTNDVYAHDNGISSTPRIVMEEGDMLGMKFTINKKDNLDEI